MNFREATINDISELHSIRMSVRENILSTPSLVTEQDYARYLTSHGKGWLCEVNKMILGFGIIDTDKNNVWALFVRPDFEGRGIGKGLHQMMLEWFFSLNKEKLWLTTAPGTRAEKFYRALGWDSAGETKTGELIFEITAAKWGKISGTESLKKE